MCLDENALADLVDGRLSADARASVESHLDRCADCRALVAAALDGEDNNTLDSVTQTRASHPPLRRGAAVSRYLIFEAIGVGGMGIVYAAYDPELDRKVAIKLLRPRRSDDDGALRARILREAQAMARLSHPNVVAVYDVGAVDNEIFVAMELVEGRTLGGWLAEKPRSWREVLEVFMGAGRGLAAAHEAGLVHRDFKPENVLIGTDGSVRVTDFGLALSTGASSGEHDPRSLPLAADRLTRTGMLLGTPAYMAPEQIEGKSVDARTDVFSFAVAFHEALYGRRPYAGDSLDEIRSAIVEGRVLEPPRTARVPAWIRRILLRALSAHPDERYASMGEMLDALARDPRRRNRRLTAATAVLAIIAGAAFAAAESARQESLLCRGAQANLAGVWDAARREAVGAAFRAVEKPFSAEVWSQTEQVLERYAADYAAMHTAACESTRVTGEQSEALLDLRMGCLEERRRDLKALIDVFSQPDAPVVTRALQAARSLRPVSDCANRRALSEELPPPADPATRQRIEEIRGELSRIRAQKSAGRYREAEAPAGAIAEQARTVAYRPLQGDALALWAEVLEANGRYDRAAEIWREAIQAAEAGRAHRQRALGWVQRAWAMLRRGKHAPALEHLEYAAAVIDGLGGDLNLEVAVATARGAVYTDLGRHEEAVKALEGAAQRLGPTPADEHALARVLVNLGAAKARQGRTADSVPVTQRALALQEKTLGAHHPVVGHTLFNLASVLVDLRRFAEARPLAERSLRVLEAALGPEHPLIASALNGLALLSNGEERYLEGRDYARRAVAMGERTRAKTDLMTANYRMNLGAALSGLRQYGAARAEFERALRLFLERQGESLGAASVRVQLGEIALAQGAVAEAVTLLRSAYAAHERLGSASIDRAQTRFALAQALGRTKGSRAEAIRLGRQSLIAFEELGLEFGPLAEAVRRWLR